MLQRSLIMRWMLAGFLASVLLFTPSVEAGTHKNRGMVKGPATQPADPAHDAKAGSKHTEHDKPKHEHAHDAELPLVGWIEISGELHDGPAPMALGGAAKTDGTLRGVIAKLHRVATDARYKGAVIYLDEPELPLSQVEEISAAIKEAREAGKQIFAFAQSYDLKSYLLACQTDQILLQNKGTLEIQGIAMEEIYLAGLFEKLGVKADFMQIGAFKGAEEPFTRKAPSEAWNKNINSLLDDLYDGVITRIAEARKLDKAAMEKAITESWSLTDEQYLERKLVDALVTRDLIEVTEKAFGEEFDWDQELGDPAAPKIDNPFALLQALMKGTKKELTRPTIAIVHAHGEIFSGEAGGGPFSDAGIGSKTLVKALGQARDDEKIVGIVLRIDSPGGSATASEAIWQAVAEVAEEKPVFVSVGSMAASGGYYIACAGDQIYVSPGTIVGSIGVVGGKFIMGGLYEKLGLSVQRRARGPAGDMFNSVEPFTAEQRALLQGAFQKTYDLFLERVKDSRGEHIENIDNVAQGRLFTGRQAIANGLADKLGGTETALRDMIEECELKPGEFDVIELPEPPTLPEVLENFLHMTQAPAGPNAETVAMISAAKAALGKTNWNAARSVLGGMMLMRKESTLLLTPGVFVIH